MDEGKDNSGDDRDPFEWVYSIATEVGPEFNYRPCELIDDIPFYRLVHYLEQYIRRKKEKRDEDRAYIAMMGFAFAASQDPKGHEFLKELMKPTKDEKKKQAVQQSSPEPFMLASMGMGVRRSPPPEA